MEGFQHTGYSKSEYLSEVQIPGKFSYVKKNLFFKNSNLFLFKMAAVVLLQIQSLSHL